MSTWQMMLSEIRFRPASFALSLLAIAAASGMFVTAPTLISGYALDTSQRLLALQRTTDEQLTEMEAETKAQLDEMEKKTRRIMRDLGVNLRIVHKDTEYGKLMLDFSALPFPEEYVVKLANHESIESIVHLVATFQERMVWEDELVLLVGMMPVMTVSQKNEEKAHMAEHVARGEVHLGSLLARGRKVGDPVEIKGRSFRIASILPEKGTAEDAQLMLELHDAQEIAEQPGMIHQILALSCKCKGDRLSVIRKELEGVLPDTKVTEHETLATAREKQRDLVALKRQQQLATAKKSHEQQLAQVQASRERQESAIVQLMAVVTPLIVLTAGLFVALLTWLNVRERRAEVGVLRALGKRTPQIAGLFLGKAALLGLAGGVIGCGAGWLATRWFGAESLQIPRELLRMPLALVSGTVVGAPLVAAMASYLPTLSALAADPSSILSDS